MKDKVKRGGGGGGGGGRNQGTTDAAPLPIGNGAGGLKLEDDTSFPVKIQGAGVEFFEMQVHGFWLVQDAVMALLAREEVCPRSSLSLALSGMTLDPLAELQSLKGLKPGSILRLVEEPYSPRSARVHLGHVLELLRASGPQDALKDGRSLSVLDTLTHTHTPDSGPANGKSLKRSPSNTKTEPTNQDGAPPEYLLPGSVERPLMALLPHISQPEVPSYVRDLSLSCWNPPPGHRKLQGDFLYITVVTIEGRRCDITSCPRGFYLNRSTEEGFDPRPAQSTPVCHCLTDLLSHVSPGFKKVVTSLKNRPQLTPVEVMPTPYRTLSWLGPPCASRSHRNVFTRLALDEQSSTQAPDWNEELQAARDLAQGCVEERVQRDRALLQVNSAFVWAVAQGAENVIDGFVEPINGNPEDPAFLWGGLFMSQGAAGATHGGERGRRAAQRLELRGVQAYSDLEGALQGLHTLPTATVDYRGVRLSAQGLAPGLEGSEQGQENSTTPRGLLYGVNAGPQESPHRRRLLELLAQSAKALSLQRHAVVSPNGHQVPLFTSVDAQGLLGADGRFYLLDLFRSLPADANYCPREEEEEDGWPENYHSESGLPKSFPHGLCRLRPELLQAFIKHKHSQFTQHVKEKMDADGGFEEEGDTPGTNAVRAACKEVGSVSDIIFEMRFNPNTFSPGLSFPSCDGESTKLQEKLLRQAAALITTQQIPAFVEYCLLGVEVPMDGASLKQALHRRGINLRYLGRVANAISQSERKERLRHIMRLVTAEMVVRSTRRIFNGFVQGIEVSSISTAVSHFLCCLLVSHFSPAPAGEETKKKSRRRGRGAGAPDSTPWSMLTGAELWNLVGQDVAETYGFTESLGSGVSHLVEQYGLQKLSLLREFCLKTGVQLRLRDYLLDSQSKAPIGPDDILNVFPVVKHIHMAIADASKAFHSAQISLEKGLLSQAHDRLKEASYLYTMVCDDLHPEACHCLSLLARVAYLQGQAAEARSVQLKAVVISERVLGFDHPNTMHQYAILAVYVYAGGEHVLAQKCLLRARLLMLTIHGEDHPYMATLDSCLGLVLTGEQAGQFLQSALRLNNSFFGSAELRTALNQHLLSQWMCGKGDYRSAMNHEKEAFTAFTVMFGDDHPQTHCSSEFLRSITQKAVRVERSLRQAGADQTEPQSPECVNPANDTILEQLVLVTGIRKNSQSDKLQEFKQKLLEQKAAALEELTKELTNEEATKVTDEEPTKVTDGEPTKVTDGEPAKVTDGEPAKVTDGEPTKVTDGEPTKVTDGEPTKVTDGEPTKVTDEEATKVTDGEPTKVTDEAAPSVTEKEEAMVELSTGVATTNGHVEEPAEQNPGENTAVETGDRENTDRPVSEAEELTGQVNGEAAGARDEEERVTQNGGVESGEAAREVKSGSGEVNGSVNGSLDIESEEPTADVVLLKAGLVKLEGDVMANGVMEESVTTNGAAEE